MLRIASIILSLVLVAQTAVAGGLYQERSTVDVITSYLRPARIEIDNTYNQIPKMEMVVESITMIPNEPPITRYQHRLSLPLDDPARQIPLYDPLSGEPTGGSLSAGDFYAIVYSLFVMSEQATYPPPPPPEPMPEWVEPQPDIPVEPQP